MHDEPVEVPQNILPWAIAVEGGIGLLALGIAWPLGYRPGDWISFDGRSSLWGILAAIPMLGLFGLCLVLPLGPFRRMRETVDRWILPLFAHCRGIDIVLISALAGIGEELMFRGLIQNGLSDWLVRGVLSAGWGETTGPWIGCAVAALVFGLLHAITPTYAVLATLIGFFLGWLYLATGNLLVPIVAHGLYDAIALAWLLWRRRTSDA
jgi:membrane protease YdiL (CAAX protease family)